MQELEKIWREAVPLSHAWLTFDDTGQAKKWKNAEGVGPKKSYEMLLIAELFRRVYEGELFAIGFQTQPTANGALCLIPSSHFCQLRPDLEQCDKDELAVFGARYEEIRICNALTTSLSNSEPDLHVRRKPGRPTVFDDALAAWNLLKLEEPDIVHQKQVYRVQRIIEKMLKAVPPNSAGKSTIERFFTQERLS